MAIAITIATVAGAGLPAAVVRLVPELTATGSQGSANQTAWRLWKLTLGLAGIVLLGAALAPLAISLGRPSANAALGAMTLVLAATLTLGTYQQELARSYRQMVLAYAPQRVVWPLATVAVLLVTREGSSFQTATSALFLGAACLGMLLGWQALRLGRLIRSTQPTSHPKRVSLGSLCGGLWVYAIAAGLLATCDVLAVGCVLPAEETAKFYVAKRCALLAGFAQFAVTAYAGPLISSHFHAGRHDELRRLLSQSAWLATAAAAAIGGSLVLANQQVLGLFGPEYLDTTWTLLVLVTAQLAAGSIGAAGCLMNTAGGQNHAAAIAAASAALQFVLCVGSAQAWGVLGAAVAVLATTIARVLVQAWFACSRWGLNPSILPRLGFSTAKGAR